MYIIRDDRGYMVGKINNFLAGEVISSANGEFREKKYSDGSKCRAFVMLDNHKVLIGENIFYLWENYYLYKE